MPAQGVEIIGDRKLRRDLKRLGRSFSGAQLLGMITPGGEEIRSQMAQNAPRGSGDPPHLADNIAMEPGPVLKHTASVDIGPTVDVFWGRYVEQGTSKMSPQPFMRPAVDDSRGAVERQVRSNARAAIMRVSGV